MALLTYFKGELACSHCSYLGVAWIASRLGDRGATYKIGDPVLGDITPQDYTDCLVLRAPAPGETVRLLTSWSCEQCGLGNVAEVGICHEVLTSISSAELTPGALASAHYVDTSLESTIERLIGPLWDSAGQLRATWLDDLSSALDSSRPSRPTRT